MKAIVTNSFVGRRDDHGESETFNVGDTIEGELAAVAVRDGNADEAGETAVAVDPEQKPRAKKGRK